MKGSDVLYLSCALLFVPVLIGSFWVHLLQLEGTVNRFLHVWVLGFTTMLAVAQLLLVPMVALQRTLYEAVMLWKILLEVLSVISLILLCGREIQKSGKRDDRGKRQKMTAWTAVIGIAAAVLILLQAYIPARYQHSDDDDARFIAEEVSAVVHGSMYREDTITADFMYWDTGEVRKDLTSPWTMFVAMMAYDGGIAPAVLSHAYLPFFLILLCYALYTLIGQKLFDGDWEKTGVFLILLSVIHLWGYTSTHTLASMILLRIWQGKAVCAGFMIPLFFYLFYRVMRPDYEKRWLPLFYVAAVGACLLSGVGIITTPILLGIYGFVDFCCHRDWRKTLMIFLAAVPCGMYLLYYLR
ncbi:DUF6077 domain-containing protein [Roseburia hominis]|uniref:DUF6077 domain-containing protein n=1 Tax=Roseburia hominis TaxID=301301 RepID=UPI0022E5EDED|nr:DUF6077 domain-containing protein [Roseburia hominis]